MNLQGAAKVKAMYFCNAELFHFTMQVLGMTRTVEVSHWGNIAVEETYHIKHVGAELKV